MVETYPRQAEEPEGCATPRMAHGRDLIVDEGKLQQDYNFIDYVFDAGTGDEAIHARHYLDEPGVVIIRERFNQVAGQPWFPPILAYLQHRFERIETQEPHGRERRWQVEPFTSTEGS